MIELKTYCDQHGVSVDTGRRRIKSGEWKSIMQGGKYYIVTEKEQGEQYRDLQGARLKEALTAMQIKKIQQQLSEGRAAIEREYKGEVLGCIYEVLTPLRQKLSSMKLSQEQIRELSECIDQTLSSLQEQA